jgi:hypothetical protein
MPTVKDVLEHAKWLIEKGRADEPAKLILPKIEAQRRRENKEQRTRVQFDCDVQLYSDFHIQLQRYRELCGNVAVAHGVMVAVLRAVSDEAIRGIAESGA